MGKLFHEYDELDRTMKHFEQENYIKLYKKESRTIEAAKKGVQIKTLIQRLSIQRLPLHVCIMANTSLIKRLGRGLIKRPAELDVLL